VPLNWPGRRKLPAWAWFGVLAVLLATGFVVFRKSWSTEPSLADKLITSERAAAVQPPGARALASEATKVQTPSSGSAVPLAPSASSSAAASELPVPVARERSRGTPGVGRERKEPLAGGTPRDTSAGKPQDKPRPPEAQMPNDLIEDRL
jgi:hypothetical protein